MSVELRERKWCGVLKIEKVGVKCCWMVLTIVNGLIFSSKNLDQTTSLFCPLAVCKT